MAQDFGAVESWESVPGEEGEEPVEGDQRDLNIMQRQNLLNLQHCQHK